MMSRIQKGVIAGFIATAVVSLVEAAKLFLSLSTGTMEEVRIFPLILAAMAGMRGDYLVGWLMHFGAGALILGPAFALVCDKLPTDTMGTKGVLFAVGAFIVMGLTVAPMAGMGTFAMVAGFPTLVWLIFTHIVFGATLGAVYGALVQRERRHSPSGAAPAH